jgi:hypothetical protein
MSRVRTESAVLSVSPIVLRRVETALDDDVAEFGQCAILRCRFRRRSPSLSSSVTPTLGIRRLGATVYFGQVPLQARNADLAVTLGALGHGT